MNRIRKGGDEYRNFDRIHVYEPDHAHVRIFVSLPRKAVFINDAAPPDARVVRVGWTVDDNLFRLPFEDE